jgi:hypothetical protein
LPVDQGLEAENYWNGGTMKTITILVSAFIVLAVPITRAIEAYDSETQTACERACSAKKKYDPSLIKKQSLAHEGDLVKCPVSGVVFEIKKDSPVVNFKENKYRTCCATCAMKFNKSPQKFAGNLN